MGKLIKKLTILATLLTFALGTIVYADDEEETISANEDKELVLYNADGDIDGDGEEDIWYGFKWYGKYDDEDVYLDIYYNNTPLIDLINSGYTVEIRLFSADSSNFWKPINVDNFENSILYIYNIYNDKFCHFRIKQNDKIISKSDSLRLKQDIEFPALLSSTFVHMDFDTIYSLNKKSIKAYLKFDDNLEMLDKESQNPLNLKCLFSQGIMNEDYKYFITNVKYDNYSQNILINDKEYSKNYCIITFYINFADFDMNNSEYNSYNTGYEISLENFIGHNYPANPGNIDWFSTSYKDVSKNPQKEAVIKDHRINLSLAESTTLNVDILSNEVSADDITFVSSDDMLASVDKNGVVTANSAGTAYIYAESKTSDEVYDYCIINVYDSNVLVPVSSIKLDKDIVSLQTGSETKLTATVLPENSTDKSLVWSSSDVNIAYVSQDGRVTANKAGGCTITCTSNSDNKIKATVHILVSDPIVEVDKIEYEAPEKVKAGKKFKIKITVFPENASRATVTFSSSNTNYATVNSNGVVSTQKAGAGKTVTITITANDGSNVSATYTFKINPIKVTRINLTASKKSVKAGAKLKISAIIKPSNATDKSVTFKVSNTKYATINSKGVLTAKKAGKGKKVTVTATAKDGSKVKGSLKIKIK